MYSTIEKFYHPRTIPHSKLVNETPNILKQECKDNSTNQPESVLHMKWQQTSFSNTGNPDIWGPAFWFSIHNGAMRYPIKATPIKASRMKGFILGIPEMIPCDDCREHARAHVESADLDSVTVGREALFCFFVEFHNYVNRRYSKPTMTCEEAKRKYSGDVEVMYLKYD